MKFQLAINMERVAPDVDMGNVQRHTLEMVQMADEGGFEIAWAAEHHALEMTIAPDPFQILAWWAAHTSRIRLGPAVVVAPYWHPIKLAGAAALLDLYSGGRLEFGIGSGAYQREFDRMHAGLTNAIDYGEFRLQVSPDERGTVCNTRKANGIGALVSIEKQSRPYF